MAAQGARRERRVHYPADLRLQALEDDVDTLEAAINEIRRAQSRTNQYLLSLMGALLVACVMLAVNVAVFGG